MLPLFKGLWSMIKNFESRYFGIFYANCEWENIEEIKCKHWLNEIQPQKCINKGWTLINVSLNNLTQFSGQILFLSSHILSFWLP